LLHNQLDITLLYAFLVGFVSSGFFVIRHSLGGLGLNLSRCISSVAFSGSSSGKSCKALYEPRLKLAKKFSSLSDDDYVKLAKLVVEKAKLEQKETQDAVDEQFSALMKEYAVKDKESKYKECLQAEKDLAKAEEEAGKQEGKINNKYHGSSASKNEDKWIAEFNK